MKKEEVLEKSRKENHGQDLYEKEILREGGELGIYVVFIMAAVFVTIGIFVNKGVGYELWAMAYGLAAVGHTVRLKACRKKRWQDIIPAAVLWGAVALNTAMYFRALLTAAVIL